LVAAAFLPPAAEGETHVCHRNGSPWDNRAENLRWATPKSNAEDKVEHGTVLRGESHPLAKCTLEKARLVKQSFARNESILAAARAADVSYNIAADISRGRTWRHA
jgi:hypothetical protein